MFFAHRVVTCALSVGLLLGPALAQTQALGSAPVAPLPDSPIAQNSDQGQLPHSTQQDQGPLQKPAGTAAAPSPKITGVAASKPAGAAYAPAKQRRVRVLLIKVGAIAAAGAAVGTVAALSHGSPSKPPGAR